ncbi:hypothetical protein MHB46_01520 [Paenibacillus sp. FSL H7-0703]|uniref:hypothetical protein n=1 Tax=unclassified Paenibacillus TaxID=185978 RepID=UPI001EEC1A78|nr:hypothetical protein [Paenibacillus sp. EKM212P]
MEERKLKIGGIIDGVGWNYTGWRHPAIPADASENIDYYVQKARQLEHMLIHLLLLDK